MFSVTVRYNFSGLEQFQRVYLLGMRLSGKNPIREGLEKASGIYMNYAYQRFKRNAVGGGRWPRLSLITIKRKGHATILVDTGTLKESLNPKSYRGQGLRTFGRGGFRVGIQSQITHPKSDLMVDELAKVHHFGRGKSGQNLPVREVLPTPTPEIQRAMARAVGAGIREAARRAGFSI